ncbi:TPA: hypothetical protein TZS71_001879 [Streptococcus suis]|nr:hypothetical protein [Streptococcus suis]
MIYILKPFFYPNTIERILNQLGRHFQVKHKEDFPVANQINYYFIINTPQNIFWDGMKVAKTIRQRDDTGQLILIDEEPDYQVCFRSHLSFLAVLTPDQARAELTDYLQNSPLH